jgi:hypothetical protein
MIDEIERLKSEGKLPSDRICMLSGWPSDDVVEVRVQCESKWIRGPSRFNRLFIVLGFIILPLWWVWAIFVHNEFSKKHEELGRDRVVYVPLRIAKEHQAKLRRLSQRRLRRILRSVPIYSQLLAEYPQAKIVVPR